MSRAGVFPGEVVALVFVGRVAAWGISSLESRIDCAGEALVAGILAYTIPTPFSGACDFIVRCPFSTAGGSQRQGQ